MLGTEDREGGVDGAVGGNVVVGGGGGCCWRGGGVGDGLERIQMRVDGTLFVFPE